MVFYIDMEIVLDVGFRITKGWKDSERRAKHVLDRMILRGIGGSQIKEAVKKGAKRIREDGSIIAEFRWFKVVYREFRIKDRRKIYPITVY